MKLDKLRDFTRGWICGNFKPSLNQTNYEIGFKYYLAGDYEKSHKHMLSDEITIVLLGEVEMNGTKYIEGDIVTQEKGEYTDFLAISERVITAVWRPDGSFPNDKYFKE